MTERAAPFYCPYCGDEDLRMFGEKHGEWRCGACQRVFRLSYVGVAADWTRPVTTGITVDLASEADVAKEDA
jgi:ribosomal protein L37AE/L43A